MADNSRGVAIWKLSGVQYGNTLFGAISNCASLIHSHMKFRGFYVDGSVIMSRIQASSLASDWGGSSIKDVEMLAQTACTISRSFTGIGFIFKVVSPSMLDSTDSSEYRKLISAVRGGGSSALVVADGQGFSVFYMYTQPNRLFAMDVIDCTRKPDLFHKNVVLWGLQSMLSGVVPVSLKLTNPRSYQWRMLDRHETYLIENSSWNF